MTIHPDAGQHSAGHGLRWLVVGLVLLVALLLAADILPRLTRLRRIIAEDGAVHAVTAVSTVPVKAGPKSVVITLPGNLLGLHEVAVSPRSNGCVKHFVVGIGSRVTRGQLQPEIETPELDQELRVARATLEQVKSTGELTRTTLERWKSLADAGVATRQEFDEKQAAYNVARANVNVSQASVDRPMELKRFGEMVAPFADVVTNVPQDAAPGVRIGQDVEVLVQALGSEAFHGRVSKAVDTIEPATRTLYTAVLIVNTNRKLMPGIYAQVKLSIPLALAALVVPANTLIIRGDGPQVAVVRDGQVHMTKIALGGDFGTCVEALTGLPA